MTKPEKIEGGTEVVTFGCRLNAFESEVMRENAAANGLDDAIIINTCAVTKEAVRQAGQAIRKAKRDNPDKEIIVTGCAAQLDPDSYASMPEVDRVLGNNDKLKPHNLTKHVNDPVIVEDIMQVEETASHLIGGFDGRARAFLQVQNGCDHRCTFCIIPYARGASRSIALGDIVNQSRHLLDKGFREIVLTGVDLTSWGQDLPGTPSLGQLVRRLLKNVPDLPRLRLSSVDPAELDDDLFDLFATEERLMPHLHLSLQAGDDMILKRMKRRHDRADAIEFFERARTARPDMVFGADLIAGFPTEDEAMFQNSLSIVDELDLIHLHVFPYSEREGTPAARIPKDKAVPMNIRKARAKQIRAAGKSRLHAHMARRVGQQAAVLVERTDKTGIATGHSEDFLTVRFDGPVPEGRIVPARLVRAEDDHMIAIAEDAK